MAKIVSKTEQNTTYELQHSKEYLTLQNGTFEQITEGLIQTTNSKGQFDLFQ